MQLYGYDKITFEYTETFEAYIDPAETEKQGKTVYMIPAYSTKKKPMNTAEHEVAVFDEETEKWAKKEDYRNCWIVNVEMKPIQVKEIGSLEEGYIVITEEQKAKIEEDSDWYVIQDGKLIKNPNYDAIKTQQRKEAFENKFLSTTLGYFRLDPKGYANAQQSIDTVNNMVDKIGSLTSDIATLVLFYESPDFSKPEQCTEEWLVQHQYSADPMTKEQWDVFYIDFTSKYAQKRYQQALQELD